MTRWQRMTKNLLLPRMHADYITRSRISLYSYIHIYICMYVYMYVCMYVCMYVYYTLYIYIYIHKESAFFCFLVSCHKVAL